MTYVEMKERHQELALKEIAGQASAKETVERRDLEEANPEFGAQYQRIADEVALARETLPLLQAAHATPMDPPQYIRQRLDPLIPESQATAKTEQPPLNPIHWGWAIGLGTAIILLLITLNPFNQPQAKQPPAPSATPALLLAIIDIRGLTRGQENDPAANLKKTWPEADVQLFEANETLANWVKTNQSPQAILLIHDLNNGEIRLHLGAQTHTLDAVDNPEAAIKKARQQIQAWRGN